MLFDAGNTLVELVSPVVEVYMAAAREVGAELEAEALSGTLKRHWTRLETDHRKRNPDLTSSEEFERSAWRSFTRSIADEFPDLKARHGDWHARLVKRFDDPDAWRPTPFAMETLSGLTQNGVRLGVVSNWHSALPPILEAHGLMQYLSFVLTSAQAGRKKPHRAIFERALERLGVAAGEAAHVGDSWSDDVEGAKAAGLTPIYLQRCDRAAGDGQGVHIVRCLSEIAAVVDRRCQVHDRL